MKSYVAYTVTIYEGIILDAATRWPDLHRSLEMDLSYLRRVVEQRGLPFFTMTLPDCCKVLDRGLDNGLLVVEDFPQGFPLTKKRPKLFGELFNLVFDECNMLRPDPCVDAVSFLRQLMLACKKFKLNCDASKLEETLNEFFKVERDLPPSHENTWDSDVPTWSPRHGHPLWGPPVEEIQPELPYLAARVSSVLPWDSFRALCLRVTSEWGTPEWWDLRPKHGPGVVSEKLERETKFDFPHWPRKLGLWFPYDWYGSGLLVGDVPSEREPASRLIAVPKSQKGPRLICAEPVAHQWMQQGIWRWLEEKVDASPYLGGCITFRSQENSRKRALRSSIDGSLATIDLSSASDRLSTRLVEYVFQGSPILDGLHASRTRVLEQQLSLNHDRFTLLRKFSTMGSACTFPVQSIVFALLAIWATRVHDGIDRKHERLSILDTCREVTVFGDDIIAPARALETIKLAFHECGLKINVHKTFGGANFRESCGCDAFQGYDVTPAYALQPYDESPSSMATIVEVSNNFFLKGYWNTADAVVSTIPPAERKLLRICGSEDGAFGLRSFCGSDISHLRIGWDPNLQRSFSISMGVTAKVVLRRGRDTASLTQYFTEDPDPQFKWQAGQVDSTRLRKGRVRVYD